MLEGLVLPKAEVRIFFSPLGLYFLYQCIDYKYIFDYSLVD